MWKWNDLKRLLLRKDAGYDISDLGAIMWPVMYPDLGPEYVPDEPHITVAVFRGIHDPDLGFTKEDVVEAVSRTPGDTYLPVSITGLEWFGLNQDVPVLRVEHPYLYEYRNIAVDLLAKRGIEVDNTYPEYKPHISITDEAALEEVWPNKVFAAPVEVWWGHDRIKIGYNS